jgi:RNA polymerase sigma-70 factor (ECF subfamily)
MNGRPYGDLRARFDQSDVVQETLVQAFENLRDFKGNTEAEFREWLKRIAENKLNDLVREHRAKMRNDINVKHLDDRAASADSSGEQPPSPDSTPSEHVMREEEQKRLMEVMDRLSPDHRQVVHLRYWDNLRFSEIGQAMDRSEEAAKKLYGRALCELKRLMNVEDP